MKIIVFIIMIIIFTGCIGNTNLQLNQDLGKNAPINSAPASSLVKATSSEYNILFDIYNKSIDIENTKRGRVDALKTKIEAFIIYLDNPDVKKVLPPNVDTASEITKVNKIFTKYQEYKQNGDELHAKEQLALIYADYYVKKEEKGVKETMVITDEFQNRACGRGCGWGCNPNNALEGVPVLLAYTEEIYTVHGAGFSFFVKKIYVNINPYVTHELIRSRGCDENRISYTIADIYDEVKKTYKPEYLIYK